MGRAAVRLDAGAGITVGAGAVVTSDADTGAVVVGHSRAYLQRRRDASEFASWPVNQMKRIYLSPPIRGGS